MGDRTDRVGKSSSSTFKGVVIPSGNATGVEVPAAIVDGFGAGKRAPVIITINGHTWSSRIAAMRGQLLIGISGANRAACGIALGDEIEVKLELDETPRVVDVPPDLASALTKAKVRKAFDTLSHSRQRQHVLAVEAAKTPATRERRITTVVEALS